MIHAKAIVRSREPLTARELTTIKRKLGVDEIVERRDQTIAGGFVVEVGDQVYDYTVSSLLTTGQRARVVSVGTVEEAGDGIASVSGLSSVMAGEIVELQRGIGGVALNLQEKRVGVVLFSGDQQVRPGDLVTTTGQILSVPVGKGVVGRVVDPFGKPLDGKGEFKVEGFNPMERIAPGVFARESVSAPLQTGVKAIDAMIPIGRGQRELIIGDRQTGKTSLALTTIINQKKEKVICVYVAIGQKRSSVAQFVSTLEEFGALDYSVVVSATASETATLQYFAPYAGCAIAEYFLKQGEDVLVVYDDLSKHAWAYRQLSLLLRRPSGREAYPGDIFYAHSRLLERACRLDKTHGGGSITALPIVETQEGDISAYIPTNVISITDGQIYLEADLFNAGQRPAINVGDSVSRVGGAAQIKAIKQVAGRMRFDLAQYRELQAFAQFASDLDEKTRQQLNRGERVTALLRQHWREPMPVEEQVAVIWAASNGMLDALPVDLVGLFEQELLSELKRQSPTLLPALKKAGKLDDDLETQLREQAADFSSVFIEKHKLEEEQTTSLTAEESDGR